MACAEALSRRQLRVCVIEKGELGRAASWAGGGLLSPLPPDRCPEAIRPLLEESLALYPEWCARLQRESGIDPEYWVCGADYIKAGGERIPYPQMAQVRNPRLLKALAETLRRRGVALLERTEALGWIETAGAVRGVRTSDGDIVCQAAVLAAGAWSAALGAEGIRPVKGQMLLLNASPGWLERVRIGETAYLIPRRDGRLLLGSTLERAGFDVSPTLDARTRLLEAGEHLQPGLSSWPVLAHWAGLRPKAPDGLPMVGPAPALGLYLAVGHFRLGITLAPVTAAHLSVRLAI